MRSFPFILSKIVFCCNTVQKIISYTFYLTAGYTATFVFSPGLVANLLKYDSLFFLNKEKNLRAEFEENGLSSFKGTFESFWRF